MKTDLTFDSSFAQWCIKNVRPRECTDSDLQREGLDVLVESFARGEITSLDGVDSAMSASIRAVHGEHPFEMNSNWILCAQDWICPCCGRDKLAVSRTGAKGQILCKLVIHHDHMGEVIEQEFCSAFVGQGTQEPQAEGKRLVARMGGAFSAYESVLICEDCNNADARTKRELGLPGPFSFSIGQMARFIKPAPHQPHEIELAWAKDVWEEARPAYELRMELIRTVARAAATNAHWYEPYSRKAIPIPVYGYEDARLGCFNLDRVVPLTWLTKALGPKEKIHTSDRARWRTNQTKAGKPLPPNYLAMLRSSDHMAESWALLAEDWRCLVCRRSKHEQVYLSPKGEVQFRTPTTTKDPKWKRQRICNHCHSTVMSLKEEVAERAGRRPRDSYGYFSPEELRRIIHPRAHSPHLIKPKEAAELVELAVTRVSDPAFDAEG